jgi:hypothetical protein
VQLKPGERVVIDYDLHTVPGQPDTPVLRVTSVTFGKKFRQKRLFVAPERRRLPIELGKTNAVHKQSDQELLP